MESWRTKLRVLAVACLAAPRIVVACGVDWIVPANHFDGVNEWGKLSYWRQIGKINLGDNLEIPIIIGFSPARGNSHYLGQGWLLSLLESNIVQVDENKFLLTQPDGVSRQFWRRKPNDNILKGQGDWMGEIKDSLITVWAKCGWKLTFNKGKITSIATPKNRSINFVYTNGRVSEIKEQDSTILRVESDLTSGKVNGISYGTNRIGIELGDKPKVEMIQGLNVIAGNEQSLHKLTLSDGTQAVYDFGVDAKLQPTLKISGDTSRELVWNSATGQALQDGEWTYHIQTSEDPHKNAKIQRANKKSQTESWFYDRSKGEELSKNLNGTTIAKSYFTAGLLAGKLRAIREINDGKSKVVESYSYDENGNVLRHYKTPDLYEFTYNACGVQDAYIKNGTVIWQKKCDKRGRLTYEKAINNVETFFDYPSDDYTVIVTQTPALSMKVTYNQKNEPVNVEIK